MFGTSYVPALSFESSSASSSLTNIKYSFSDSSQGLYNQFIVTFSHGFVAQHAPNADTLLSNVESNNMVDAIKYNFADKFGYTVFYSHTIAIKNSVVINISNYISSDNIDSFIESAKDISGVEDIFPDYNIDYQGISDPEMNESSQNQQEDTPVPDLSAYSKNYVTPNDEYFDKQWDLHGEYGINVKSAWQRSLGDNVTVAVIDTGVNHHPDLVNNIVSGYDFLSDAIQADDGDGRDSDPSDSAMVPKNGICSNGRKAESYMRWHGTHIAGTIAASANNKIGISGISPNAKILPVRAFGPCGTRFSDVTDAIKWAGGLKVQDTPENRYPAQVINLSFGSYLNSGSKCFKGYQDIFDELHAKGIVVVASAGNKNLDVKYFTPANCNHVISVSSTTRMGERPVASYGSSVSISAPGGTHAPNQGIFSTFNTGMISVGEHNYSENAGTSMAAPHISAIAALAKSVNPDATPDRILSAMQKSAQNRPIQNCDQYSCGPGIVDAGKTLEYLDNPVKNPDPWNNGPIFYNIHKNMPFYQEIQWIGAQGITTGYPDGTFHPADNVERGAMAAFFYRYAGQPEYVMPSTSPFRDVSVGSSFYREITWLHSTGIANGWQDGTYRPVDPIRRDAMAAFIYRYAHKK